MDSDQEYGLSLLHIATPRQTYKNTKGRGNKNTREKRKCCQDDTNIISHVLNVVHSGKRSPFLIDSECQARLKTDICLTAAVIVTGRQ